MVAALFFLYSTPVSKETSVRIHRHEADTENVEDQMMNTSLDNRLVLRGAVVNLNFTGNSSPRFYNSRRVPLLYWQPWQPPSVKGNPHSV